MHGEPSSSAGAQIGPNSAGQARLSARLDRHVVLVGMMGSGKTSVGRRLAAALGWCFVDADDEIETAAQMTIPEIFAAYGEPYFRAGERRVIARLLGESSAVAPHRVIATGGGAYADAATRALVNERALAVWLDVDLDTLVARTARKSNRPLLETGDRRATLARLLDERRSAYAEAPLHITSGTGAHSQTVAQVLDAIAGWLDARGGKP